jgi:hypothetical protein
MAMSVTVNRKRHLPSKPNNTQNKIPNKILRRDYELNVDKTSEKS